MKKNEPSHNRIRIFCVFFPTLLTFLFFLNACRDQDTADISEEKDNAAEAPPSPPQPDSPVVKPAPPIIPPPPVHSQEPRKAAGPAPSLPDPVLPEITPLKMTTASQEVTLPGPFKDLVLGGGGRFIILHFKNQRTLGVFDVSVGKIVKFIPVASDDILFAANADSLTVLLRDKMIIQRWSLTDFDRTLIKPITEPEQPTWMVMGSASAGPLALGGSKDYQDRTVFYDPATFKKLAYTADDNRRNRTLPGSDGPQVRASANGQVITAWRKDLSPAGLYYATLEGGSLVNRYEHSSVGYIHPSPDGQLLFTAEGLYTPDLKPLRPDNQRVTSYAIPAAHGSFYLSIPSTDDLRQGEKAPAAALHLIGDTRPLITLPTIRIDADRSVSWSREDLSLDKRVIYVPDAQVAITYPEGRDKLILHQVNLEEELKKSEIDYLFITSRPDNRANPGETWAYKIDVSSRNEVTLNLESAPDGMKVAGKKITWDVPEEAPSSTHLVVVCVKDTTGQELVHNFNIAVGNADPGTAPAATPPKATLKPMKPSQAPEIKPPDLGDKDHVPYKLPAALSNIDVGGDGRFLVMHFPSLRKLGIFDVNAAKIVKYIPANDDNLHFAAGLGKLIIIEGGKRLVSRWDLHSFEREVVAPLEVDGPPHFAVMGSNSEGPFVIGTADGAYDSEAHFFDLANLRKLELERSGELNNISGDFRASANGRVFTSWSTGTSPSGVQILVKSRNSLNGYYEHSSAGYLAPGPKGDRIYSFEGIWTNEATPVGSADTPRKPTFPAVHGDFYLSLESDARARKAEKANLGLYLRGHDRLLLPINGLEPLFQSIFDRDGESLPVDKRLHFIPAANLLVTVGLTKDVLNLYPIDIEAALAKSETEYLLVTTRPPAEIQAGQALDYQMKVLSRKGGITFKLESGPDGMTLGEDGLLVWDVPANSQNQLHSIIILVSDKSGQEVFHTFDLQVEKVK